MLSANITKSTRTIYTVTGVAFTNYDAASKYVDELLHETLDDVKPETPVSTTYPVTKKTYDIMLAFSSQLDDDRRVCLEHYFEQYTHFIVTPVFSGSSYKVEVYHNNMSIFELGSITEFGKRALDNLVESKKDEKIVYAMMPE
jgi:hypothetical protein